MGSNCAEWFSYDPEDGVSWHMTEAEAREAAEAVLEEERDHAPEGWREDLTDICWGRVYGRCVETERRPANKDDGEEYDEYVDYDVKDIVGPDVPARPPAPGEVKP